MTSAISTENLLKAILDRRAKLGVIGLGYVGLPVACEFARAGFHVIGIDVSAERVAKINNGVNPIEGDEPGLSSLIADVINSGRLKASTDYQHLADADIITINVETPVDENHQPRYVALRAACASLAKVLKRGALVIVESTVAPGTTTGLVQAILEEGTGTSVNAGFWLGVCPERVMPGKLLKNLRTLSRVCGGSSPAVTQVMLALYSHVVQADLDTADIITAEIVKTAENAYRDVQIAFANEVALICEQTGADVYRVRELVNKSPGRNMLLPGAGVGGHCIPKDPWLLAYAANGSVPVRLIPAARAVNESMPRHAADLVLCALDQPQFRNGHTARVAVLGYAYLENSDDTRHSPSADLVAALREQGVDVVVHDPFVKEYQGDVMTALQNCDAAVLMVAHSAYRQLDLHAVKAALRCPVLVDGRGFFDPAVAHAAGLYYRGVGR
jgi:UDP-N-acetyl-D-mannosaminuronic acid dehydrogenase